MDNLKVIKVTDAYPQVMHSVATGDDKMLIEITRQAKAKENGKELLFIAVTRTKHADEKGKYLLICKKKNLTPALKYIEEFKCNYQNSKEYKEERQKKSKIPQVEVTQSNKEDKDYESLLTKLIEEDDKEDTTEEDKEEDKTFAYNKPATNYWQDRAKKREATNPTKQQQAKTQPYMTEFRNTIATLKRDQEDLKKCQKQCRHWPKRVQKLRNR
jgi:hypothetical protein